MKPLTFSTPSGESPTYGFSSDSGIGSGAKSGGRSAGTRVGSSLFSSKTL